MRIFLEANSSLNPLENASIPQSLCGGALSDSVLTIVHVVPTHTRLFAALVTPGIGRRPMELSFLIQRM